MLWWACCGLAALVFLVLASWLLSPVSNRAVATSHRAPYVYDLSDCRIEKNGAQNTIYQDTIYRSKYQNFYICDSGTNLDPLPHSQISYICIPFTPGTIDFQDYSLPPREVTQAATLNRSRYPVPVYPDTIETASGLTINCLKTPLFATFAVVCEFTWDPNRPPGEGPLKVEGGSLDACSLEAAWRDPPEADAIGKITYPLDNCQDNSFIASGTVTNFYKCSYGTAASGYEAPSLCILFTSGGEWYLEGKEGQTYRYAVNLASVAGCSDLESSIDSIAGVDSATLSFAINCGFSLFGGGREHPLAVAGFNDCNLGVDWDDLSLSGSEVGINLGEGERFEEVIDCESNDNACGFLDTVNSILSWMAYLVVPIVIIVIVVGGVQLSLAGDNPEATKKAKMRITQAVAALVCYILLWSVLRWLI